MRFSERVLLGLCRRKSGAPPSCAGDGDPANTEEPLAQLAKAFPRVLEEIKGKRILDYGCGHGYQARALVLNGAAEVAGIDINQNALDEAGRLARKQGVSDRVKFHAAFDDELKRQFDIVISQNSMEHFEDPEERVREMVSALKIGGRLYVSFGPPWFSPYGAHLRFMTPIPWIHLLFAERTVMAARSRYRSDGATRYGDVPGGLNRMTVAGFERLASDCGLVPVYRRDNCSLNLSAIARIPLLRELLTYQVNTILRAG